MSKYKHEFGTLLSAGIRIVAARENKSISIIEDELGYALGRKGGSVISRYRRGNIPPKMSDIEILARILVHRGDLSADWLCSFLDIADYHFKNEFVESLLPSSAIMTEARDIESNHNKISLKPGAAPPLPFLMIGREEDINNLKKRLFRQQSEAGVMQVLTTLRGWPGVGKTTIAAALAHDPDVIKHFPDGILWASLGPNPHVHTQLIAWGIALGNQDVVRTQSMKDASQILAAILRRKRILLIVDDVWQADHAWPLMIGGQNCGVLVTTRINSVAQAIAPIPDSIYLLPVLKDEDALLLMQKLAQCVVEQYPIETKKLLHELEGLPLAIQVAGRLLNVEAQNGFNVNDLLQELREGTLLLTSKAPADRTDLINETTPTVAVLLQKSTDYLDEETRNCFALLGVFAPKPASFDINALKYIWQMENPKPIVQILVARGLLEPIPSINRFQMHALLVKHAGSLLGE